MILKLSVLVLCLGTHEVIKDCIRVQSTPAFLQPILIYLGMHRPDKHPVKSVSFVFCWSVELTALPVAGYQWLVLW